MKRVLTYGLLAGTILSITRFAAAADFCGCAPNWQDKLATLSKSKHVIEAVVRKRGERIFIDFEPLDGIATRAKSAELNRDLIGEECRITEDKIKPGHVYIFGTDSESISSGENLQISICDPWVDLADNGSQLKAKYLSSRKKK